MLQIVVFDEGIYADRSVGVYNISIDPYKQCYDVEIIREYFVNIY